MKKLQKELNRIVDQVLAYRPTPRSKAAKKRVKRKEKFKGVAK